MVSSRWSLEPRAPGEGLLDERFDVELVAPERSEQDVLVWQQLRQPVREDGAVEQVLHPQAQPPGAVAVRRADPAACRAHLRVGEPGLVRLVEGEVVRHDHVRAAADAHPAHVDPAFREGVELVDQRHRVDHDPVADHRRDVRVEHARRRQAELEHLVAPDDGMTGVVAALVAHDHRDLLGQEVGRLALALVAPLEPDDHGRRHQDGVRGAKKKPRPMWAGTWIDDSLVAPRSLRRTAVGWLQDRLTGRSMRLEARCLDPPNR